MATIKYAAKTNSLSRERLARLKIMKTVLSQSKLIRSIRFFTNRRVFLNPTEILKRKLIISICVLTRENNPWRVVF